MKKILILILILTVAILLIIIFLIPQGPSVVIDNKYFRVDVARTAEEQTKGLAIYNSLPKDKGMVFPFNSPDYYTFWMKDMKFPIDIIYIRNNKIVDIFSNVPAPTSANEELPIIKPKSLSDTVLEINAGLSKKYNFKIGDTAQIKY